MKIFFAFLAIVLSLNLFSNEFFDESVIALPAGGSTTIAGTVVTCASAPALNDEWYTCYCGTNTARPGFLGKIRLQAPAGSESIKVLRKGTLQCKVLYPHTYQSIVIISAYKCLKD